MGRLMWPFQRRTSEPVDRHTSSEAAQRPILIGYSAVSGVLGMVLGAAASLVADTAVGRLATWCGVTVLVSVGAGLMFESSTAETFRRFGRNYFDRFSRS